MEAKHPAVENLRTCQRQLDADGCEVGVSRQALDEALALLDQLLAPSAADLLHRVDTSRLDPSDRLIVMAQNPMDSHRWSKAVSDFITAAEISAAIAKASGVSTSERTG